MINLAYVTLRLSPAPPLPPNYCKSKCNAPNRNGSESLTDSDPSPCAGDRAIEVGLLRSA